MNKQDFIRLGYIVKAVGTKWELRISVDGSNTDAFANSNFLFIDIDDNLVPYYITSIKQQASNVTVTLEDVQSSEEQEELLNCEVYLPNSSVPNVKQELNVLLNYKVSDKNVGTIGAIQHIINNPSQSLFEINNNGQVLLMPAVDEFIVSIDHDRKIIFTNAPEGLFDINRK